MSLTPEQLEQRRHFVGASESPCLLGVSPHGNACSVWTEKMGLTKDDPTTAQQAGNFLEDGIGRWYVHETGHKVAHFGSVTHPRHPFMGCTPDLCIFGERRIAQIKLVGTWMLHHWEDDVPEYVQIQVQHEMEVCNADVCDVVVCLGGTDLRILPIARDREIGEALVEICRGFMRDYVKPRIVPPVDESKHAERLLKARYQRNTDKILAATPETDALARAWLKADVALDAAKAARDGCTNKLKAIIGESLGIDGDSYRARWSLGKTSRTFTLKEIALKKARAA